MAIETLQLPNLTIPREGVYSCGQPTREQLGQLKKEGLRSIVSLRPAGEHDMDERTEVERLGMRYHEIPVSGPADVNEDNARRLSEIMDDPANQPILVHCGSGNRVGALYALKAFHFDDCEPEEAVDRGRSAGLTQLEPVVRKCLACE